MGGCGIGSTPAGVGYTAPINSTAARVLLRPDGTRGNVARINVVTGDFVLGSTGEKVGWDSTSQRVYLALRTVLGSSAVQTLGIDLPTGGVITANMEQRIRNAVLAALKSLTTAGLIEVVDVVTTRVAQSGVQTVVTWRDTGTGELNTTTI
jgi:hypothetical protein